MTYKKAINGYEGKYEVWDDGTIFSLKKNIPLKPFNKGNGYLGVRLWKNGKCKDYKVHRLVAEYFCEKPTNTNEVNHIDEDKTNNKATNLEWCDRKTNCNYGRRNEKISKFQLQRWNKIRSDEE